MASHSSPLAWKIPWVEEPGGLQSMELLGVRHDCATSFSLFTFMHWRRKWQPTPVFLPGESRDGGAWWAAVSGVAQSRTRLKQLSSSSSSCIRMAELWWRPCGPYNQNTDPSSGLLWNKCVPFCLRRYILSGPWSSTSPKLSEDSADKEERQEVTMFVTWLLSLTSYCPVF